MTRKELKLTLIKSTKGTHVYGSTDEDDPISSVYIKRAALPNTPPLSLTLTIEYDGE